ncbi:MAG: nickel-dependent hydrogenase large subunit [Candidatus Bathyarchaeia archaeon]
MSSFKIPIGPQHPALKEAENFTFTLDGELVIGAEARIGYMHRGIEKLMETKNYIQNIPLVERICGICNVAHTLCYCQNVEYLYGKEIPRRAEYIRVIIEELNRIHSHLLWMGIAAHEIGFDTLFMYIWRDREVVMDLIELITGNRVSTASNTIGGVRRDIDEEKEIRLRKGMDILKKRTKYYKEVSAREPSLLARLEGVGILTPKECVELCAVGPTARASGVKVDVRADDPYAAHDEIPFNVITYDNCDLLGRFLVRADETIESINMVEYCLDHMPKGPIRIRLPNTPPRGESVSRVEAPRGEDIHYVKSNGTDKPERYKVRAPTLGNLAALVTMLTTRDSYEVYVADLPIILAGIDPCMCCMDRSVKFIELRKGKEWVWTWNQLKQYSKKLAESWGRVS